MLLKRIFSVFVIVGILGIAAAAPAQTDESTPKKSIVDRIDDFNKSVFGKIFPAEKSKPKPEATTKTPEQGSARGPIAAYPPDDVTADPGKAGVRKTTDTRAESVLPGANTRARNAEKTAQAESDFTPENMPSAVVRSERPAPKPAVRPLHERLSNLRQSPFEAERSDSSPSQVVQSESKKTLTPETAAQAPKTDAPTPETVSQSPNTDELMPETAAQTSKAKTLSPETAVPSSSVRPMLAQRVVAGLPTRAARSVEPLPEAETETIAQRLAASNNAPAAVENLQQPASKPASDDVLFTRKGPMLSVETMGPRTIVVGRESTYQVYLLNSGEAAAEELVVHVSLPEWAEVAAIEASVGDAKAPDIKKPDGAIQWKLARLDAKSRERLTLKIVPRQSRPFDLSVRWDFRPAASQAMIEVQEAKLALQLDGPRDVLYGKKELYTLKLTNSGNGVAENVVIQLTPIGAGENLSASHKLGLLGAGQERSLEVELTARQAGDLLIQAEAKADGGIRADLSERVLVRRAALKVDVEGPKVQYVGAVAGYAVRIRNSGTAPARDVHLTIALPAGAKYLSGVEGAKVLGGGDKLDWTIETLNPEVEQSFTLKCKLAAAGAGRLRLSVAADDDLTALAETIVQVEAVANLTMDVKDPTGPVPVGEEAVYEVRVRNRGTKEARNVEVFGYFSRGIEPTAAEGAASQLGAGQVVFQPIASIGPGEEVMLKVRAKAETAGNHVFRAEAHCKPLGARLVSEATNLYYGEVLAGSPATKPETAPEPPAAAYDAMRTIPRPLPKD